MGSNGLWLGSTAFGGGAKEYAFSDDDGDGIWSVTVPVLPGLTGQYIFLNGGDAGESRYPTNQWCADNERFLPPVTENTTIHLCYGDCSNSNDGSCTTPAPTSAPTAAPTPTPFNLTFHVNTELIEVGGKGVD